MQFSLLLLDLLYGTPSGFLRFHSSGSCLDWFCCLALLGDSEYVCMYVVLCCVVRKRRIEQ